MVGTEIRKARISAGLNQKQLAALIDRTPNYVSQLENNHRNSGITIGLLEKIAQHTKSRLVVALTAEN